MPAEMIRDRQFSGSGSRKVAICKLVIWRGRGIPDRVGVLQNGGDDVGVGAAFEASGQRAFRLANYRNAGPGIGLTACRDQILTGMDLGRQNESEDDPHTEHVRRSLSPRKSR